MKHLFNLIFFFIPHHHIGGAERVHLNIIKALKYKPIVFFDYSNTSHISEDFKKNAYCFLVTNNRRRKTVLILLRYLSYVFNITIFGCNSSFFYKCIAKNKNRVRSVDLTHAFSYPEKGMEIASLEYIPWIDNRIVINNKTLEDYKTLYKINNVDAGFLLRFRIIENGIQIYNFDKKEIQSRFNKFTIGFVGRNSAEKRPKLFFDIVKKTGLKAKVIGDNFEEFKKDFKEVVFFENCNNSEIIRNQFSEISVLIVTSSREGFPLVIMEAMELGIPVITTNVGSISDHISNDINGFLANNNDETAFLLFVKDKLNELVKNKEMYTKLSLNAREYASKHFSIKIFEEKYRQLFYE